MIIQEIDDIIKKYGDRDLDPEEKEVLKREAIVLYERLEAERQEAEKKLKKFAKQLRRLKRLKLEIESNQIHKEISLSIMSGISKIVSTTFEKYFYLFVPAIAYFVARLLVGAFAHNAGIEVSKLGLDYKDYLLISTIMILYWILIIFYLVGADFISERFLELIVRSEEKDRGFFIRSVTKVLHFMVVKLLPSTFFAWGVTFSGLTVFDNRWIPFLISWMLSFVYLSIKSSKYPLLKVYAATSIFLMVIVISIFSVFNWTSNIKAHSKGKGELKLFIPLSVVIHPKKVLLGSEFEPSNQKCVLLINGDVFFEDGVVKVRDIDSYQVSKCQFK